LPVTLTTYSTYLRQTGIIHAKSAGIMYYIMYYGIMY
jgi:hypothetical protein